MPAKMRPDLNTGSHTFPTTALPSAFILAGGFGTRLEPVVADRPKPMAIAGSKPFLEHLLRWLRAQGIRHVVLLVHHMGDMIESYFGTGAKWDLAIEYVRETQPLGTGGAVIQALMQLTWNRPFFLLNGDSFIDVDLTSFYNTITDQTGGMVLSPQSAAGKYGAVTLNTHGNVKRFSEKGTPLANGLVNAGCYFLQPALFRNLKPGACSLETDLFPRWILNRQPVKGYICKGFFIDIGTPEDYTRFQTYIKEHGLL